MTDLKLPKLPDRTPVKLTISLPPDTHSALLDYLAAYKEAYDDKAVRLADIVPAMIDSFIQGDRSFARARRRLSEKTK